MSYVLHLSSTVRLSLCIPVFASGAINGRLNRAMIGWNLEEHGNHTLEIRRMRSPGERRGQFLFRARAIYITNKHYQAVASTRNATVSFPRPGVAQTMSLDGSVSL
jgi:hypothetical protein